MSDWCPPHSPDDGYSECGLLGTPSHKSWKRRRNRPMVGGVAASLSSSAPTPPPSSFGSTRAWAKLRACAASGYRKRWTGFGGSKGQERVSAGLGDGSGVCSDAGEAQAQTHHRRRLKAQARAKVRLRRRLGRRLRHWRSAGSGAGSASGAGLVQAQAAAGKTAVCCAQAFCYALPYLLGGFLVMLFRANGPFCAFIRW